MDTGFKRAMFITSFLPLWASIVFLDFWSIVQFYVCDFSIKETWEKTQREVLTNISIECISILVISVMMWICTRNIDKFIHNKEKATNKEFGIVKRSRRANKLSSEFLLAYILPMIAFDFSELKDICMFTLYFLVLSFLCVRNNNVYTNIYFEFKGYKMYECDIADTINDVEVVYQDCLVLSQEDLINEVDNNIVFYDFNKYVYIKLHNNVEVENE